MACGRRAAGAGWRSIVRFPGFQPSRGRISLALNYGDINAAQAPHRVRDPPAHPDGQLVDSDPDCAGAGTHAAQLYRNAAGLPIGVQLVAAYGREDLLLRITAQLEAAQPFVHRATRR